MSAATGRLSEDNLRELARIVRGIHARAAAKHERQQEEAASQDEAPGGEHDA
jgi:aminoglycoside phosphotransferase family enzyme